MDMGSKATGLRTQDCRDARAERRQFNVRGEARGLAALAAWHPDIRIERR